MNGPDQQTVKEFFDKFNNFPRYLSSDGDGGSTVLIHPGFKYGFIELREEFVLALKKDLETKLMLSANGLEDLDPTTKFAVMMLAEAY